MNRVLAVIPARYGATRFPGKPLAPICGKPMIQWIFEAASHCDCIERTVIATDDERIAAAAKEFNAEVMMTSTAHQTGTDRLCEVAERLTEYDVYVNVQGDQPFVDVGILATLLAPFGGDRPPEMATVACPFLPAATDDPNVVKVVCDQAMNAIYFSRCAIPFRRQIVDVPVYHHLGLYAYTRAFLFKFHSYPPTPLEQSEQLEQLRAIEHGHAIRVSLIEQAIVEVNTPADLEQANDEMTRRLGAEVRSTPAGS